MGPDEHATSEELGLVVKALFAKVQQQAGVVSALTGVLMAKGILSREEVAQMIETLTTSPEAARAKKTLEDLREFAAIRKIARQYLDPHSEDL
jgi:hypothetical protein